MCWLVKTKVQFSCQDQIHCVGYQFFIHPVDILQILNITQNMTTLEISVLIHPAKWDFTINDIVHKMITEILKWELFTLSVNLMNPFSASYAQPSKVSVLSYGKRESWIYSRTGEIFGISPRGNMECADRTHIVCKMACWYTNEL